MTTSLLLELEVDAAAVSLLEPSLLEDVVMIISAVVASASLEFWISSR